MGLNQTGMLDTGEYTLGRGIVYLAPLIQNLPGEYRDIGNATELNVNVETETLEHQSSRQGLAVIDKEIVVSQKMSLTLTFDSINFQNLALFFSGETGNQDLLVASDEVTAGTSVFRNLNPSTAAEETFDADDLPFWFDIYVDRYNATPDLKRLYNIDATSFGSVTIEGADNTGMNAVTLTEDTHFTVQREMGRIFINQAGITALAGGTNTSRIQVVTAASINVAADTDIDEVRGLRQSTIANALKFIAENPADNNELTEYQFHKVTLRSEGDFSLVGDEFTTGQLNGTVEENATADPNSPFVTTRTYQQTA